MTKRSRKLRGKHFASLRDAQNLTQQEVADRLNLHWTTVSGWETGKALPGIELLPRVADLYGTTIEDLIDGARAA